MLLIEQMKNMENINHELYHKNYISLAKAIMHSGGEPFSIMQKFEELLIVLSNNDIIITAHHENTGVVRSP